MEDTKMKVTDGFDRVLARVRLDKLIDDMSYEEKESMLKDAKDCKKYKSYYNIICDLLGYKQDMDNTEIGFMFKDIALLKKTDKKQLDEEFD